MTIRPEFESPSNQNIKEWRLFIAGQLRRSREARSYFDRGDGDWNRLIDNLEKPGVYENDCGDLILPTIAHCFCVDLIVFNTKKTSVPFTPVSSTMWTAVIQATSSSCLRRQPLRDSPASNKGGQSVNKGAGEELDGRGLQHHT